MTWTPNQKKKTEIRSLRHQFTFRGRGSLINKKISLANKPELKKIVKFFSSSNFQVTISRVSISVLKGRPKRKIWPTLGHLCSSKPIILSFLSPFFFLNGPGRTATCSLYAVIYIASQYLIEIFTVRCIFSLRRDIGKQTMTYFAYNNYNPILNLKKKKDKFGLEKPSLSLE